MNSLSRYLLRHYLFAALAPLILLGIWLSWDLDQRRHDDLRRELREKTLLARRLLELDPKGGPALLAQIAGRRTGLRLTLIRGDGKVIADSHEDPARMENHANRPEIRSAMATRQSQRDGRSSTSN